MKYRAAAAAFASLFFLSAAPLVAQDDGNAQLFQALGRDDCPVVPLWPNRNGPGETRPEFQDEARKNPDGVLVFRPVVRAEMIVIAPPAGRSNNGVAVLLCPGGGYGALETQSITQASKWLNEMGATAVLLKYRVPRRSPDKPAYHLPLMDAQRAMGLLRSRAAEWKLDPQKIGIIGFSAGGHLAALASNRHAERSYEPIDDHDRTSCRPDFCLLMYPAYLTQPILEMKLDSALEPEQMSPTRTPPTFIAVVRPDKFTVGCLSYFDALRMAAVPTELHVYASGGHGGCFDRYPLVGWGCEGTRFLKDHGVLDAAAAERGTAWIRAAEGKVLAAMTTLPDTAGSSRTAPRAPTAAVPRPLPDAMADADLAAGDVELRKLLGPGAPIIPLWPEGVRADDPLARDASVKEHNRSVSSPTDILRIGAVTRPTLAVMRAEKPDGRAVIICPGGGYHILASDHEGVEVGRWLNKQGITALVLKYRVPKREGVPTALQDIQRAVRLVRSRAEEFGVDPSWIGVLGFSAGGHLAAEGCHRFEETSYAPIDEHDKASCRPDFGLLIYPGYLTDAEGKVPAEFSAPQRNRTPPIFVTFAANDRLVAGAPAYVAKLREARVPTALHIYGAGGHGRGLRPDGYPFSQWTFAAQRWLSDLTLKKP